MSSGMAAESPIIAVRGEQGVSRPDWVAVEEPLEIRLAGTEGQEQSIAITMRTPGHDVELAVGFLWSEGILTDAGQLRGVQAAGPVQAGGWRNRVIVTVERTDASALPEASRHFYMTSSCGICGKASIEAIETQRPFVLAPGIPRWTAEMIPLLPERLRAAQATFDRTGGLHAAALFDASGTLLSVREDVGRHNAVDKLIGAAILDRRLPLSETLLLVSGRASFELVQKAVMAGIPALAAVGAPSSLAVTLARETRLTLLGFVRGERFNIYAGEERIAGIKDDNDGI